MISPQSLWFMLVKELGNIIAFFSDVGDEGTVENGVIPHAINRAFAHLDEIHYDGNAGPEDIGDLEEMMMKGNALTSLLEDHSSLEAGAILSLLSSFLAPFLKLRVFLADMTPMLTSIQEIMPELIMQVADTHGKIREADISFWALNEIADAGEITALQESMLTPLAYWLLNFGRSHPSLDLADSIEWQLHVGEEE